MMANFDPHGAKVAGYTGTEAPPSIAEAPDSLGSLMLRNALQRDSGSPWVSLIDR